MNRPVAGSHPSINCAFFIFKMKEYTKVQFFKHQVRPMKVSSDMGGAILGLSYLNYPIFMGVFSHFSFHVWMENQLIKIQIFLQIKIYQLHDKQNCKQEFFKSFEKLYKETNITVIPSSFVYGWKIIYSKFRFLSKMKSANCTISKIEGRNFLCFRQIV